ncbi:MAG TPA: efflux transporter outer membrane subunit [Steroidobacteraceae bacterium]|nr:efflux transporter outer membrane subunit [Steroidobacteraceae bacterium]
MSSNSAVRVALPLLAALGLCSCAIGPNYKRPGAEMPQQFKNATAAEATRQAPPDRWWTLFNDPMLDQLIEQVEVSNQNLAESVAAYSSAVDVVRQARAGFLPSFSGNASDTHVQSGGRTGSAATVGSVTVNTPGTAGTSYSIYQLSGSANWELDVWGKLRRTLEQASETARADLADLANARLSAQNQLATAYLELRGADAEHDLLASTVIAYQRTLTITENRYRVGTAAKTDVLQAETQLFTAQQQEAALSLQRVQLEDAIAALVGRAASNFHIEPRKSWNIPVPLIPAGVPSELLKRRPDIAAAEHQVAAANANIGIQESNYFPTLTLTGSYGLVSSQLGRLLESGNSTTQFAGTAAGTIFNFGLTQAQVAQARAQWRQAVATYRQTILSAFQSVENDLAATDWDKKEYDILKQASAAADENERLTINEYKAGTVDYTTVVVAQTSALSARLSLAQMAVSQQTAAVSLVTDLGGGWTPATVANQ